MQFVDEDIKLFWDDPAQNPPRRVPSEVRRQLYRKLQMLDAACDVNDLRIPLGNRLEALQGERKGQHSIRLNARWRLCFRWENGEATEVEFCDYH